MKLHEVYEGMERFYKSVKSNNDGSLRAQQCLAAAHDLLSSKEKYRWFDLGDFKTAELGEFEEGSRETGWVVDPFLKLPFQHTVFTVNVVDAKVGFANPAGEITHAHLGLEMTFFCQQLGEDILVHSVNSDKQNRRQNVGSCVARLVKIKNADGLWAWKVEQNIPSLNDDYTKYRHTLNELDREMSNAARMMIDYALNLLTCKNIYVHSEPPIAALNKKRNKKGLPLAVTRRTIRVAGDVEEVFRYGDGPGSHKSPCIHLRRGHLRRLASGDTTWVRACVVGKQGEIMKKQYEVKRA